MHIRIIGTNDVETCGKVSCGRQQGVVMGKNDGKEDKRKINNEVKS